MVDCWAMARSAAAMVQGYQAFDPDLHIGGLLLNKVCLHSIQRPRDLAHGLAHSFRAFEHRTVWTRGHAAAMKQLHGL